jgi:predicted nucleic-acid-binding protein
MIGIDTNVLVRYLMQDEPTQASLANAFFDRLTAEQSGFVSTVTLVETCWLLRSAYGSKPADLARVVEGLLQARELTVEAPAVVRRALDLTADGLELPDTLVVASGERAGCSHTVTCDAKDARSGLMQLLA